MKNIQEPIYREAEKCINLRKLSKQGIDTGKEGHEYCRLMFEKFPKWYKETEERVFNETVPFGSNKKYGM